MPLPQIKICAQCLRKFNAFSDAQDTCTSCLSKPHRNAPPIDPEEIEASLAELDEKHAMELDHDSEEHFERPDKPLIQIKAKNMPEKICPECQKPFTPTSGVQKWCSACGRQREIDSKKRWADRQAGKGGNISVASTPKLKKLEREVAATNKKLEKISPKSYNTQEVRAELIIGLLIQLELISPQQVESCDRFIREMHQNDGKLPEM